jgi:CO dehydrogenase maturation factor
MGLKIAVAGKGGVGKTTVTALLGSAWANQGFKVLLVDADPDANLAAALGLSRTQQQKIVPLSRQYDLIEERTGARPGESYGSAFILNPDISDIVEKFGIEVDENLYLVIAGSIEQAGQGCFCPESALLKAFFEHLVLERTEFVVMDMEAGLEHLGRSTTKGIDLLITVVEPGMRSVETALKIRQLARELGISNFKVVLNRVDKSTALVREKIEEQGLEVFAELPFDVKAVEADVKGDSLLQYDPEAPLVKLVKKLAEKILKNSSQP